MRQYGETGLDHYHQICIDIYFLSYMIRREANEG